MRDFGLTVSLGALGNGEVNTVLPVDNLLQPESRIAGPLSPGAPNCSFTNLVAKPRMGYTTLGNKASSTAVTGLFHVQFDNNVVEDLRSDGAKTYYLNAGTWTDISAAGVGGYWTYAMVRRAGGATIANQVFLSGDGDSDKIWRYRGSGAAAVQVGDITGGGSYILGARVIVGHKGRALIMNMYDPGAIARKVARIWYSIVGDPETFTGTGSGYIDLDDEPYPICGGLVISGNVCVFKGNNVGGAITVGTSTGVTTSPYRWDTLNTAGIGLLIPRSLVQISPDLVFFLGHDGFYIYDGGRGLARVGDGIAQDLLTRINPAALKAGFSEFNPITGEVVVHVATGASTTPNEAWVFNIRDRRVYGPYTYADTLTAASLYSSSDTLTWDTIPFSTWDSMTYSSWDTMGTIASKRGTMYGTSTGYVMANDGTATADNGVAITTTYKSGAIRAEGRKLLLPNGTARELEADTVITLRDLALTYRNAGSWTPTVEISTDGGLNWTTISDGVAIGSDTSNLGRFMTKNYSMFGIPGTWFQARITATSTVAQLSGIRFEFTYSGNDKNS